MKSGIETILHKGSGLLEKAKEELGSHSDASRSKDLGKLHSFRVASKIIKKEAANWNIPSIFLH